MALLLVIAGRWPAGQRPDVGRPVRIHASSGWGQPAVSTTAVFYLSKDHQVFAVDRATGEERWRRRLGDGPEPTAGSVVLLADETVMAGDGDVFALDAHTGATRWRAAGGPQETPGRFLGTTLGESSDRVVVAGSATGWLTAWHAVSGRQRWRTRVTDERVTVFAPVADADIVVAAFTDFGTFPRSGGVVAVDAQTGRQRWLVRFPVTSTLLPASAAGRPGLTKALVAAAASDGMVYVMSRETGHVQWTVPPPLSPAGHWTSPTGQPSVGARAFALSPPTEHEDFRVVMPSKVGLVITSLTGVSIAVDLATRRLVWQHVSPPNGSNGFGLTLRGETAYVPFASGRVVGIDVETGRERCVIEQPQQRFDWPPVASGDRLYLTAGDGLYGVDVD